MVEEKVKKVTYFSKKPTSCPVCATMFYKEEIFSGGGRLLAGKLTEDLRRHYEPSKKFGELFPLIYFITVCPSCYYATFPEDFIQISDPVKSLIKGETEKRMMSVSTIFKSINFTEPRSLNEGIASYFLSVMNYEHFEKRFSPTAKRGISCIRTAWLYSDLHRKSPGENYDYLSKIFYRKAYFFYRLAIEREQKGEELLSGIKNLGPDLDKNYGYEGLLYISGLLEFLYGPRKNIKKRIEALERIKRVISKTHGIGKATKEKPSSILEKAKDLYDKVGQEIQELKIELT